MDLYSEHSLGASVVAFGYEESVGDGYGICFRSGRYFTVKQRKILAISIPSLIL